MWSQSFQHWLLSELRTWSESTVSSRKPLPLRLLERLLKQALLRLRE